MFIFEHQSGEFGLYLRCPDERAGGLDHVRRRILQTSTIIMKNQIFIPDPCVTSGMRLVTKAGETKRLEIRCDLLYIDSARFSPTIMLAFLH